MIIDTHTHIFSSEFDGDRSLAIERAAKVGIKYMLMPNVDIKSITAMKEVYTNYPAQCLPMMGLHPCSVNNQFEQDLQIIEQELRTTKYFGVGEIGLDFYWDQTYKIQQETAFIRQCRWAHELNLATSMHTREATDRAIELLRNENLIGLKGVFHCFTGTLEQAKAITAMGFALGIGGVVTYKNTDLREILKHVPLKHIVLETDAPYLPPVPYRGKRNEPSYLSHVVSILSEVYTLSETEIAYETSNNAIRIFGLTI